MLTKRQSNFSDKVVEAARTIPLAKRRGRPMPKNLTKEGRVKGLIAMQKAPRCISKRRDGQMCRNPSMRGATKCVKHGGRVQVPKHPHNIRRFLSGDTHRAVQRHEAYLRDRETWEMLSIKERRSFFTSLPEFVINNPRKLYRSVRLLKDAEGLGVVAMSRILSGIKSGELL